MYCTLRFSKLKIRSDSGPDEILTGIEAVAFQHELDHLDGITMHKRKIQ
jgi:peptide deformylase